MDGRAWADPDPPSGKHSDDLCATTLGKSFFLLFPSSMCCWTLFILVVVVVAGPAILAHIYRHSARVAQPTGRFISSCQVASVFFCFLSSFASGAAGKRTKRRRRREKRNTIVKKCKAT